MRTFLSILFLSTLMASVGTTATRIKPVRDYGCWVEYIFTPDEEMVVVCGEIPPQCPC